MWKSCCAFTCVKNWMQTAVLLSDGSTEQQPGAVMCLLPSPWTQHSCDLGVLQFCVCSMQARASLSTATLKPIHKVILFRSSCMSLLLESKDLWGWCTPDGQNWRRCTSNEGSASCTLHDSTWFTCKIRKSTAFENAPRGFHWQTKTATTSLLQAAMRNEISLAKHFPKYQTHLFILLKWRYKKAVQHRSVITEGTSNTHNGIYVETGKRPWETTSVGVTRSLWLIMFLAFLSA